MEFIKSKFECTMFLNNSNLLLFHMYVRQYIISMTSINVFNIIL